MTRYTRRIALLLLILAGLLGTAFVAKDQLRSLVRFYARPAQDTLPGALAQPQSVTLGDTRVTLVRAVASASQTVVEFTIESPVLAQVDASTELVLWSGLQPGQDLHLTGFAEQALLNSRVTRREDAIHLVLELPPPATFGQPVTIQFDELTFLQIPPGAQRGEPIALGGPWRFQFTPQLPPELQGLRRIPVDQSASQDGISVYVEELRLSSTETLVVYRLDLPPGEYMEPLGAPTLRYGQTVLDGQEKGDPTQPVSMLSFPALPEDVQQVELNFGPFLLSRHGPVELRLDLAALQGEGQVVQVENHRLRFLPIAPIPEGFQLTYEPADPASARLVLGRPGGVLEVKDDRGNSYPAQGGILEFDPENGMLLKRHEIRLTGPLDEQATQLILRADLVGVIIDPVQLSIALSPASAD